MGLTLLLVGAPLASAEPALKPATVLPAPDAGSPLVFNEEFRSLVANPDGTGGWKTRFFWGDRTLPANNERQLYTDATTGFVPFTVRDGRLEITAEAAPAGSKLPYRSGLLTSQTLFAQRFGYFEIRAKLPAGRGLWPAFWLLPEGGDWPPEIDVFEMLGHAPGVIYASVHWKEGAGPAAQNRSTTAEVRMADSTTAFHVYGVSWHPDIIRWYVDGREVAHAPTPAGLDRPMYMLINLAVGGAGSWPGAPDAATRFPARMIVDYVRAFSYAAPK